jgi:hypothetical protein
MKIGIVLLSIALVLSIVTNLFFSWKALDFAVTKDHMQIEIATCHERQIALLRLSQAFSTRVTNDTLKAYIRSNMRDLEIVEQGQQFIVNGASIRFDTTSPTIE